MQLLHVGKFSNKLIDYFLNQLLIVVSVRRKAFYIHVIPCSIFINEVCSSYKFLSQEILSLIINFNTRSFLKICRQLDGNLYAMITFDKKNCPLTTVNLWQVELF